MITTLIVGASGATGKLLVEQLLERGTHVRVIVRSPDVLPKSWRNNKHLSIISASLLSLSSDKIAKYVKDCDAIASCLGHNLSLKGIYGQPRKLVMGAVQRLCEAVIANNTHDKVKFVLMNTAGNSNRDLDEAITTGEKIVIGLLRGLLPPHVDNEEAADYLRSISKKQSASIEWVAVRPDDLVNKEEVSAYDVHPSPIRSAIFNAGKTSRINVAHFMADLITDTKMWQQWQGQMPVIYNK